MPYGPITGLKAGPAPVSGVLGFQITDPEATPAERHGNPADVRHGNIGEIARPYPWQRIEAGSHGPYGVEAQMLGEDYALVEAGYLGQDPTADLQPFTHAAPWPKGTPTTTWPEDVAPRRIISDEIHAADFGASRRMQSVPTQEAVQDAWVSYEDVRPGSSLQDPDVPKQMRFFSGPFASTDRVQSFSANRQNTFGFDELHLKRRVATGSIPGNYMWLQPGARPLKKTIAGPARLATGNDSPFTGDDIGDSFNPLGATLMATPPQYSAPPEPKVAVSQADQSVPEEVWY